MKSRIRITERLVKIDKLNDDFDLRFWKEAGSLAIFSAAWGIIKDYYKMKELDESKLRLRRYIQNIKRR